MVLDNRKTEQEMPDWEDEQLSDWYAFDDWADDAEEDLEDGENGNIE